MCILLQNNEGKNNFQNSNDKTKLKDRNSRKKRSKCAMLSQENFFTAKVQASYSQTQC